MQTVDLLEWLPAWTKVLLDVRITTFVIAVATLINVGVAAVLWQATNESAKAAKRAAKAAVRSAKAADHTVDAMYRPYFAVSRVSANELGDQAHAHILVTFKNYGPVPLIFDEYQIEMIVGTRDPTKSEYREQFVPQGSSVVLPNDEASFRCGLSQQWLYTIIHAGDVNLIARAVMVYTSLDKQRRYEFRSEHRYQAEQHLFEVITSTMT